MFERKHQKLAPTHVFVRRILAALGVAAALLFFALGLGVLGYHWFAGLGWIDSLLNASMILGGMGPVDQLTAPAAKVFASFYALFSGLMFIAVIGIVLMPIIHRIMHAFHLSDQDFEER
jgi:hypothetical protein